MNPESADEVEMDSMWSRIGGDAGESILDDKTVSFDKGAVSGCTSDLPHDAACVLHALDVLWT